MKRILSVEESKVWLAEYNRVWSQKKSKEHARKKADALFKSAKKKVAQ